MSAETLSPSGERKISLMNLSSIYAIMYSLVDETLSPSCEVFNLSDETSVEPSSKT